MNKIVLRCMVIVAIGAWLIVSICEPWVLSDQNKFLENFVNHELLNFLGVIVAITLASAAQVHLELNRLEEVRKKEGAFKKTRAVVKRASYTLIGLLAAAGVVLVIKPLLPPSEIAEALCNGFGLLIVLMNILGMLDLTVIVFGIEAVVDGSGKKEANNA